MTDGPPRSACPVAEAHRGHAMRRTAAGTRHAARESARPSTVRGAVSREGHGSRGAHDTSMLLVLRREFARPAAVLFELLLFIFDLGASEILPAVDSDPPPATPVGQASERTRTNNCYHRLNRVSFGPKTKQNKTKLHLSGQRERFFELSLRSRHVGRWRASDSGQRQKWFRFLKPTSVPRSVAVTCSTASPAGVGMEEENPAAGRKQRVGAGAASHVPRGPGAFPPCAHGGLR